MQNIRWLACIQITYAFNNFSFHTRFYRHYTTSGLNILNGTSYSQNPQKNSSQKFCCHQHYCILCPANLLKYSVAFCKVMPNLFCRISKMLFSGKLLSRPMLMISSALPSSLPSALPSTLPSALPLLSLVLAISSNNVHIFPSPFSKAL